MRNIDAVVAAAYCVRVKVVRRVPATTVNGKRRSIRYATSDADSRARHTVAGVEV